MSVECHVQLNSRGISSEDGLREAWMDQINQAYADGLDVEDCKGKSPLECATREGNKQVYHGECILLLSGGKHLIHTTLR